MTLITALKGLHDSFFSAIEKLAGTWFLSLFARFGFLAVLYFYFLNSWKTKTGDGPLGWLLVSDNAYYQIVPWAVDAAGGEIAEIGLLPSLVVHLGALAELLLPLMIVAGLFTRIAAIGMIIFVIVQSFVDIRFHGVDAATAGAWFDRFSDALIWDQRLLWVLALTVLAVKGAGAFSLDHLLSRWWKS
ncbi:MAG: DoxX family protein [Rhizobiaceae bacterium]